MGVFISVQTAAARRRLRGLQDWKTGPVQDPVDVSRVDATSFGEPNALGQ